MWVLWMWMDSRCTVHNMCGNGDHHVGAMDVDSRCTVHNMCGNGDHHVGAMDVDGQQVYSTQHVR